MSNISMFFNVIYKFIVAKYVVEKTTYLVYVYNSILYNK